MQCSNCGSDKSRVIDTRKYPDCVQRIRICIRCNQVYKTWEVKENQIAVLEQTANPVED